MEGILVVGRKRRRLADRRKAVGLSQERLAEAVGVETSTVARWERGETNPLPVYRPRLAETLNVPVEEVAELLAQADEPVAAGPPTPATTLQVQHPVVGSGYERLEGPDTVTAYKEPDTKRRDALKLATALVVPPQITGTGLLDVGPPLHGASPRPTGSPWAAAATVLRSPTMADVASGLTSHEVDTDLPNRSRIKP
jgi:transcriptional regulator with XRE-family HTH domain